MTEPTRIQRKRTKGWRMPEGAVYVGRPTYWGNPFHVPGKQSGRQDGLVYTPDVGINVKTRQDAVDAYYFWLHRTVGRSGFSRAYEAECELAGKDLACWCPLGVPCHADVLLLVANRAAVGVVQGDPTATELTGEDFGDSRVGQAGGVSDGPQ